MFCGLGVFGATQDHTTQLITHKYVMQALRGYNRYESYPHTIAGRVIRDTAPSRSCPRLPCGFAYRICG